MKSVKLLFLLLMAALLSQAQTISPHFTQPMGYLDYSVYGSMNIGSGKTKISNYSSYLEVGDSLHSRKGLLFPRGNKDSVASPTRGLVFYDIPTSKLYFYNGSAWVDMSGGSTGGEFIVNRFSNPTLQQNNSSFYISNDGRIGGQLIFPYTGTRTMRWQNSSSSVYDWLLTLLDYGSSSNHTALRVQTGSAPMMDFDNNTGVTSVKTYPRLFWIKGAGNYDSTLWLGYNSDDATQPGLKIWSGSTGPQTSYLTSSANTYFLLNFDRTDKKGFGQFTFQDKNYNDLFYFDFNGWDPLDASFDNYTRRANVLRLLSPNSTDVFDVIGRDSTAPYFRGSWIQSDSDYHYKVAIPHAWNDTLSTQAYARAHGGGGTGTVTSVGLSTPSWLTVSSSPVTTSGTLAVTATTGQTANQFLATPNGSTGAVSLRSIVAADIPDLGTGYIKNQTSLQSSSNFNISGNGKASTFTASNTSNVPLITFLNGTDTTLQIKQTTYDATYPSVIIGSAGTGRNLTSLSNTIINSGMLNDAGNENTAVGKHALYSIKYLSGDRNLVAALNTAIGSDALGNDTTGTANTAVGQKALVNITSGNYNTAVGKSAGADNQTGNNNTYFGHASGQHSTTTGNYNSNFGDASAQYLGSSASNNTYLGGSAGQGSSGANNTGSSNTGVGKDAMFSNTSASQNAAVGYQALYNQTSGGSNTAIGYQALLTVNGGINNIAIGSQAGYFHTGSRCIFIGAGAGNTIPYSNAQNLFIAGADGNERIDSVFFGKGWLSTSPTNYTILGTAGSGTNIAGGNVGIAGGRGTGNALSGAIPFFTSDAGSSGTTRQSYTEKMRVASSGNLLIGTTTDVASSILTLVSTTKGFLPSRMTTTNRDAISSPAEGLQAYNTTTHTNDYYNGSAWVKGTIANSATFSGDASTLAFTVTHGGGFTPNQVIISPTSSAMINGTGGYYVSAKTSTTFTVTFLSPPASGTNNITFDWLIK